MSRKDYELIAAALCRAKPCQKECCGENPEGYRAWRDVILGLSGALRRDNPRFDPVRFEAACKGEEREP
ncbi:MAG TPA: hypothetical protein VFT36_00425 [Methylomirabilota bacterium]|nr:hypothetical protein [Methylomirabilota bacterium]